MADTEKRKDSFVAYIEWEEYLEDLDDLQKLHVYEAMFSYARTGETPELSQIEMLVFKPIMKTMERQAEKYKKTCERRSEAGKKGMASRWGVTKDNKDNKCYDSITNITKITDREHDNDHEHEHEHEEDKSSIPPISPKGFLKGDYKSFTLELLKSFPKDKVDRNPDGLMRSLKENGVDEWKDVEEIFKATNYGQLDGQIWKTFNQLATKTWRPDNMAAYLVKVARGQIKQQIS